MCAKVKEEGRNVGKTICCEVIKKTPCKRRKWTDVKSFVKNYHAKQKARSAQNSASETCAEEQTKKK